MAELSTDERAGPTLAVDLGGTRMRAAVIAADGEVSRKSVQATPHDAECPEALIGLVGEVLERGETTHAVIGVPGRVDYGRGRLEHAPNLPSGWPQALDEELLGARLGLPVRLANDADLAAVGEACFGAGRGHRDVAYLTISTGMGAGVVLDGRLVAGTRSLAEVGHTVIDQPAALRGAVATLEHLGSGTALERRAAEVGLPAAGAEIIELVHAGDPDAARVWDEVVAIIAVGVANLAFLFSPTVVVLGGGVGRNGDLLIGPVEEHLRAHGPPDLPTPIRVVEAALGDDAGLVGAAGWLDATEEQSRGR
jgi:glucokinase